MAEWWIFSEAGAGWTFGLVSLLILVVTHYRKIGPQQLVFEETLKTTPVSIREEMRSRITIQLDGVPVENISQLKASIKNTGGKVIKEPELQITFPTETKVIDASFINGSQGNTIAINHNEVTITMPFLNSFRDHAHVEKVTFTLTGNDG